MLKNRIYFLNTDNEIKKAYEQEEFTKIKEERQLKFKIKVKKYESYHDGYLIPFAKIKCSREDIYIAHVFIGNDLNIEAFDVVISLTDAIYGIGFDVPDYEYNTVQFY